MKPLFIGLIGLNICLALVPVAIAQENWVEVTTNAVGDRFLVDRNSIEVKNGIVWYWEYRDFQQPNNAFVGIELAQPVYGAMVYRSVDCASGVARLRRMVVHGSDRQVLQRLNYDDAGGLSQPQEGSSSAALLRYVCSQQPTPTPATTP